MTAHPRTVSAIVWVLATIVSAAACGPKPAAEPPSAPISDLVVLVPDPESSTVGRAYVAIPGGPSVELKEAGQATRVFPGKPPSAPAVLDDADVQRLFAAAMQAQPPAPRQFLLYFDAGSDDLTAESQQLLTEVLAFVKTRLAPDVIVIGHTDTTGSAESNVQLGLRRAMMIRSRLVRDGLDAALVTITSHGEADLLVPTPDDTAAPLNRRVEVSVR